MVRQRRRRSKLRFYIPDAINCSKRPGYTPINNAILRNPNLSFKAKGILATLLSNHTGWKSSIPQLKNLSADGGRGIRSGLQELESANYLRRYRYVNKRTKQICGSVWAYTDEQGTFYLNQVLKRLHKNGLEISKMAQEKPKDRFPHEGFPHEENVPLIKPIYNKTNKKRDERAIFLSYISRLPRKYRRNSQFRKTLKDWVSYVLERWPRKLFTEQTLARQTKKLLKHGIESAIVAIDSAIEREYSSFFPKPLEQNECEGERSQKSTRSPKEIICEYFEGKGEPSDWVTEVLNPALGFLDDKQDGPALAAAICAMAKWLHTNQKRDPEHSPAAWYHIPHPYEFMKDYVAWLKGHNWGPARQLNSFRVGSKMFRTYRRVVECRCGYDLLTGEEREMD